MGKKSSMHMYSLNIADIDFRSVFRFVFLFAGRFWTPLGNFKLIKFTLNLKYIVGLGTHPSLAATQF